MISWIKDTRGGQLIRAMSLLVLALVAVPDELAAQTNVLFIQDVLPYCPRSKLRMLRAGASAPEAFAPLAAVTSDCTGTLVGPISIVEKMFNAFGRLYFHFGGNPGPTVGNDDDLYQYDGATVSRLAIFDSSILSHLKALKADGTRDPAVIVHISDIAVFNSQIVLALYSDTLGQTVGGRGHVQVASEIIAIDANGVRQSEIPPLAIPGLPPPSGLLVLGQNLFATARDPNASLNNVSSSTYLYQLDLNAQSLKLFKPFSIAYFPAVQEDVGLETFGGHKDYMVLNDTLYFDFYDPARFPNAFQKFDGVSFSTVQYPKDPYWKAGVGNATPYLPPSPMTTDANFGYFLVPTVGQTSLLIGKFDGKGFTLLDIFNKNYFSLNNPAYLTSNLYFRNELAVAGGNLYFPAYTNVYATPAKTADVLPFQFDGTQTSLIGDKNSWGLSDYQTTAVCRYFFSFDSQVFCQIALPNQIGAASQLIRLAGPNAPLVVPSSGFLTAFGVQLPSASGTSSSVMPQTGWWWNAAEPGRGYSIEVQGGKLFAAAYMYRSDGSPVWYVLDAPYNGTSASGTFTEYTGAETLSSGPPGNASSIGGPSATISFTDAANGSIQWSSGPFAQPATTNITRYPINGSSALAPPTSAPQTGWWWNPSESGTGYFIEQQGTLIFMAAYLYDADKRDSWYYAQGTPSSPTGGVFGTGGSVITTMTLNRASGGQTLTSGPLPSLVSSSAGQVALQCGSATSCTITLPSGRALALTRFSSF